MRSTFILFVFLGFLFCSFSNTNLRKAKSITTIVIDAGHGGHDSGCLGKKSQEKHVALKIALLLGRKIQKTYPDIKVIYTRKTDVFIPLHKRADIANKNNADLFISIHCNATQSSNVLGTETFVMGLHKNSDNLNVAKRENDVILKEDNYNQHYDGFDPNSPASNIIFKMYQNAYLSQSIAFATFIQDEFNTLNRKNRGVKQAGFLVLYKTYMPSVLIESGFLTNLTEEKLLNSTEGQTIISSGIFTAFNKFKKSIEKSSSNKTYHKEIDKKVIPNELEQNKSDRIINNDSVLNPGEGSSTWKDPPKPKYDSVKNNNNSKSIKTKEVKKEVLIYKPIKQSHNCYYSVQISSSVKPIDMIELIFKDLSDVKEMNVNGRYKYISGQFLQLNKAISWQIAIRNTGIKDAFVVAFKGNKQITLKEAKELIK